MGINQMGDQVVEEQLFCDWGEPATDAERDRAIAALMKIAGVAAYRTNATKHGNTELVFRLVD